MATEPSWQTEAEKQLGYSISALSPLGGGDFASAYRAELDNGNSVFVKTHAEAPSGFFSTEAQGLQWLHQSATVAVPKVLALSDQPALLALEWIETRHNAQPDEVAFGRAIARLHQQDFPVFGRPDKRPTGSLGLPNLPCANWVDFYASCRLLPLARIAHDRHALPDESISQLENIASRLPELGGPPEPAALLHGDLWAGNRVIDAGGVSWVVDPAAHGGHREFDLAMMRLFGGFSETCFAAYHEANPVADDWQQRIALHQLAPLVVHAIKFGGHYVSAVAAALRQY